MHPIDNAVHALLNSTLRPLMRTAICDGAGGRDAGLAVCASPFVSVDEPSSSADDAGVPLVLPLAAEAGDNGGQTPSEALPAPARASATVDRVPVTQDDRGRHE